MRSLDLGQSKVKKNFVGYTSQLLTFRSRT